MYLSTSTFNLAKSKYLSKKYRYKHSSPEYFENFSQVQSSTLNATIMFHNGEGEMMNNNK